MRGGAGGQIGLANNLLNNKKSKISYFEISQKF